MTRSDVCGGSSVALLPVPVPYLGEPRDNAVCVMPCEAASAAMARAVTLRTLQGWLSGSPELAESVVTVVSELVANASSHGHKGVTGTPPWRIVLGMVRTAAHLMCVVSDPGDRPLRMCPLDVSAECGRGLRIVDLTAGRWGWYPSGPGKVVWAVFAAPPVN